MPQDPDADLGAVSKRHHSSLLEALRPSMEAFSVPAGEHIFHQNDVADGMHAITAGRVSIKSRTLADGLVELAQMGPGDIFGELSLIDHMRRSAMAVAVEPTSGYFMAREQFERLLIVGDPVACRLATHIRLLASARTRATLGGLALDPLPLAERRGHSSAGQARIKPTQSAPEIADLLQALHPFRHFKPAEIGKILQSASVFGLQAGSTLTDQGAPADGIHIVLRGAVRMSLHRPEAMEQLLIHGPGKIIGCTAAIDGLPHPVHLDVREDAWLVHMGQTQLKALESDQGGAAIKLLDLVSKQITRDLRSLSRHQGRRESMVALNHQAEVAHV